MKKSLFQYAILFHKYEKDSNGINQYVDTETVIAPNVILARNEREVAFKATREVPDKFADLPEQIEILVRPF